MAGQIKITPEELESIAKEFIQKAGSFASDLNTIKNTMAGVLARSDGQFKAKAEMVNNQITDNIQKAIQKLQDFGTDCNNAAKTIREADIQAANQTRQQ